MLLGWALCSALVALAARAGAGQDLPDDITKISLGELLKFRITSVSKVPERPNKAAAALFVLNSQEIRRSGATTLPDVLRLVPGLEVAQIDANSWAVTSRFANNQFNGTLLVLIDGRSVYTPLNGGVNWDLQDLVLEDIERIEVIRGPNAALWGANAATGVINIVTKSAKETHGGMLVTEAGSREGPIGTLRYGDKAGDTADYRVWGKLARRDELHLENGMQGGDDWTVRHGGFRVDWDKSPRDNVQIEGDVQHTNEGQLSEVLSLAPPSERLVQSDNDLSEADLQVRWARTISPKEDMALKVYFDRTVRDLAIFDERRDAYDLDFQYRKELTVDQELLAGFESQSQTDSFQDSPTARFRPRFRDAPLYAFFAQDRIRLDGDKLLLTLGNRVENNDYSGTNLEPNVRLAYSPNERDFWWTAVSRSTRTPARLESDGRLDIGVKPVRPLPVLLSLTGNPNLDSEIFQSYELGYRTSADSNLSLDAQVFYNVIHDLIGRQAGARFLEADPAPLHLVRPLMAVNGAGGHSKGFESSIRWKAADNWNLIAAYTLLDLDLSKAAGGGSAPRNQVNLRSLLDLRKDLELDATVWVVGALDGLRVPVPGYTRLDLRLGWRPRKELELSLVGQNLVGDQHVEFSNISAPARTELERALLVKATWGF